MIDEQIGNLRKKKSLLGNWRQRDEIWQIGDNFTCYVYKNCADNKFVIRCADNTATLVQHAMVKREEDKERRECSEVSRKEYGRKIADNQCQWPTKHYGMSTCRCPWWRGLTPQPVSSRPLPWYLSLFLSLFLSISLFLIAYDLRIFRCNDFLDDFLQILEFCAYIFTTQNF